VAYFEGKSAGTVREFEVALLIVDSNLEPTPHINPKLVGCMAVYASPL
jgi:hypothetical protein